MDRLTEPPPFMRSSAAILSNPRRLGAAPEIPCSRRAPTRKLLHISLLLRKWSTLHGSRLVVREEPLVRSLRQAACIHRAIGDPQAGAIGRYRQATLHEASAADLGSAHRREPARVPAEFSRAHARDSVRHPGVAIYVGDVDVVHHRRVIHEPP